MRYFVLALALFCALPPVNAIAAKRPAKVKPKHGKIKPKKIKHNARRH